MRVIFTNRTTQDRILTLLESDFTGVSIEHTIDDFSSCSLSFAPVGNMTVIDKSIAPFDNIYIEDDDKKIVFGGVVVNYRINRSGGQINAIDHRWLLSRFVTDSDIVISQNSEIETVVKDLVNLAKSKRIIPIIFDEENSELNPDYFTEQTFKLGSNIAACIQKIIQSVYARWAIRYEWSGDAIVGRLILRSVRGISPEGVGISRTGYQTEDGTKILLMYQEGNSRNNLEDFDYVLDAAQYTSRTKVGYKNGGVGTIKNVPAFDFSATLEYLLGAAESFVSDYNIDSEDAAIQIGRLNQTPIRQDFTVTISPDIHLDLNCGDRVALFIDTPILKTNTEYQVRIDSISMERKEGYFTKKMLLNSMSPIKRIGTSDLLAKINSTGSKVSDIDISYLNS